LLAGLDTSVVQVPQSGMTERPTCESTGHILLNENTAFGHLDRDSDDDVLEGGDFISQLVHVIDERIQVYHRRYQATDRIVPLGLPLHGLR